MRRGQRPCYSTPARASPPPPLGRLPATPLAAYTPECIAGTSRPTPALPCASRERTRVLSHPRVLYTYVRGTQPTTNTAHLLASTPTTSTDLAARGAGTMRKSVATDEELSLPCAVSPARGDGSHWRHHRKSPLQPRPSFAVRPRLTIWLSLSFPAPPPPRAFSWLALS